MNWAMLVLQVVAFVIVFALVWIFVVKRIAAGMAKREADIRKTFEDMEAKQASIELQAKEYARKLKEIEEEGVGKMKAAVAEGLRLKQEIEAEARRRAEAEFAKTQSLIRIESDQAVITLRLEAARLAMEQAEQILARRMDGATQDRLVEQYIKEVERVKQV